MNDRTLTVRVTRIVRQTPEILAFELAHPWGRPLPPYSAGAHLDVLLPGGFTRQYSIARAPGAADAPYVIAAKHEPAGRGGSASLHRRVREGDLLPVRTPRNTFPVRPEARRHVLLAGGIGMTPLLAMAQALQQAGADFVLCCFARSREHLAFAADLARLAPHVRLHFDDPAASEKIALHRLLAEDTPGTHLYACGPAGFMQAVAAASAQWPPDRVHSEFFAAPAAGTASAADTPFELVLARRGITVAVEAGQSAVAALHELGIAVPTSCEQGLCGTCVVGLQGGEADHRDHCLSPGERAHKVALCCSRARAGRLVVDL